MLSQLLRKAKQKNMAIPNVKQAGSEQGTYEGATVSAVFTVSAHNYIIADSTRMFMQHVDLL